MASIIFDNQSVDVFVLDYRRSLNGETGEICLQTPLVFPNGDFLEIIAPEFLLHITATVDFHRTVENSNFGYLNLRSIKDILDE